MYEEFSKVIHGMAKNNVYCPRCSNLVALEWSSVESGTHMFGCTNRVNCDWHKGIAIEYPDKSPVPVLEELWRSIALDLAYERESRAAEDSERENRLANLEKEYTKLAADLRALHGELNDAESETEAIAFAKSKAVKEMDFVNDENTKLKQAIKNCGGICLHTMGVQDLLKTGVAAAKQAKESSRIALLEQRLLEVNKHLADYISTVRAMIFAARGGECDIDTLEKEINAVSTKPSEYIAHKIAEHRKLIKYLQGALIIAMGTATDDNKAILAAALKASKDFLKEDK